MTRQSRESMMMFLSCVGITALLCGLVPGVLRSWGLALIGGAVLSAIWTVVVDALAGVNPMRSLIGVLLLGAIVFGMIYGLMWYLMTEATAEPGAGRPARRRWASWPGKRRSVCGREIPPGEGYHTTREDGIVCDRCGEAKEE